MGNRGFSVFFARSPSLYAIARQAVAAVAEFGVGEVKAHGAADSVGPRRARPCSAQWCLKLYGDSALSPNFLTTSLRLRTSRRASMSLARWLAAITRSHPSSSTFKATCCANL